MLDRLAYRKRPCENCPWRKDAPPGEFPAERYEVLAASARRENGAGYSDNPQMHDPMFACHKSADGKEIACAGWLAVCGSDHVRIRVAVIRGEMPPSVLRPGADWPELFETYQEMAATQAADPTKEQDDVHPNDP